MTANNKHVYNSAAWQRLRRLKLNMTPYCEVCWRVQKMEPAVVVDHLVAISSGGPAYPGYDGLMSLCTRHHNEKTRQEQLKQPHVVKGCGLDGQPIDRAHPFYQTPYTPSQDNGLPMGDRPHTRKISKLRR